MAQSNRQLAIILGSVLGGTATLLLIGCVFAVIVRRRRTNGSIIARAVTPLDDAEFESWRRPSTQIQWREKSYSILPEKPPPALTRMPPSSRQNRRSRQSNSLIITEKDLEEVPTYAYRPKPTTIRAPEPTAMNMPPTPPASMRTNSISRTAHIRNQSSMSLRDRPPTPFSQKDGITHMRTHSASARSTRVHHPSVSEASDFDFGFQQTTSPFDKI
ncbi:hypothetical protein HDK77DRAFT_178079 [Phyllosticta capitalensis]|uniref:Uncharacterized protein n=1 Tax=Phyllosticta capitalensis TaxID=121624 RepID=A0ABR1YUW2_9PEZI